MTENFNCRVKCLEFPLKSPVITVIQKGLYLSKSQSFIILFLKMRGQNKKHCEPLESGTLAPSLVINQVYEHGQAASLHLIFLISTVSSKESGPKAL